MKINAIEVCFWLCIGVLLLAFWRSKRIIPGRVGAGWGTLPAVPHVVLWPLTWLCVGAFLWFSLASFQHAPLALPWPAQAAGILSIILYTALANVSLSRQAHLPPIGEFLFTFRRENKHAVSLHFRLRGGEARRAFDDSTSRERYRRILAAIETATRGARQIPHPVSVIELTSAWFAGGRHGRTLAELFEILEQEFPGAQITPCARRDIVHVLLLNLRYCYTKRFSWHAIRKLLKADSYWERGFVVRLPACDLDQRASLAAGSAGKRIAAMH